MNKSIQTIISLLAVGLLLATVPAHAAKVPKADICHLDADTGIFLLKSVGGKALEPHLSHGDLLPGVDNGENAINLDENCMLVIPPLVLARAYIDVNDDGAGYDAEADIDIAVLKDANADGVLSTGDTLELDAFPTSFTPCAAGVCDDVGTFDANQTTTVILPLTNTATQRSGETDEGFRFSFTSSSRDHSLLLQNFTSLAGEAVVLSDDLRAGTSCPSGST